MKSLLSLVTVFSILLTGLAYGQETSEYRGLIVTALLASRGVTPLPSPGPIVPTPTPTPTPGPVPLKDCPRCKGTGFITHGDGHKTPCPEEHSASELAAHYKRIATMMGGVATARSTLEVRSLTAEEYAKKYPGRLLAAGDVGDKEHPDWDRDVKGIKTDDDGCPCCSGGECTCENGCKCTDCTCQDCPGKSRRVKVKVCNGTGCREVTATAEFKDGYWFVKPKEDGQWRIWKRRAGAKKSDWHKAEQGPTGAWRLVMPEAQTVQASKVIREYSGSRAGQHSHRCGKCGNTWSHYPGQSHTCKACGYNGPQNYVQINSGSSRGGYRVYRAPAIRQPRRLFASRGG